MRLRDVTVYRVLPPTVIECPRCGSAYQIIDTWEGLPTPDQVIEHPPVPSPLAEVRPGAERGVEEDPQAIIDAIHEGNYSTRLEGMGELETDGSIIECKCGCTLRILWTPAKQSKKRTREFPPKAGRRT